MTYLTRKQKGIYDFISEFIEKNGFSPSIEEIAQHYGNVSLATVYLHLQNLAKKGLIKKQPYKNRAIELIKTKREYEDIEVPVFGYISQDAPFEKDNKLEFIRVPQEMLEKGHLYALIVRGNYLADEFIKDGDYLIIGSTKSAENGDLALILSKDVQPTIQKVFSEGDKYLLMPLADTREIKFFDKDELKIQGVVLGVIRKYFK